MMRPSTHWLLGLVVLAVPALIFLPGIGFESSSPSALARKSAPEGTWYYRVQPGDVLTRIAERELGTFKRYKEILALNPGIEPRALVPGAALRMPPRVRREPARADTESGIEGTARGTGLSSPTASEPTDSRGLLLSFAALLGALVLIVLAAGRFERMRDA